MRYIGIDPGVTGAVAELSDGGIRARVLDIPTFTLQSKAGKNRTVLHAAEMYNLLRELIGLDPSVTFLLEAPSLGAAMKRRGKGGESIAEDDGRTGQSVTSIAGSFLLNGQISGMLVALAAHFGIRYEIINPQTWKRQMMPGEARDKDAARQKAIQLFPSVAEELKRKKDHNRAEALLLAEWGRRRG